MLLKVEYNMKSVLAGLLVNPFRLEFLEKFLLTTAVHEDAGKTPSLSRVKN
jgi:hypothetical protein